MEIVTANQFKRKRTFEPMQQTIDEAVFNIIQDVRKNKDRAVKQYTKQFDQVDITNFLASDKELQEAFTMVDDQFLKAIERAIENITTFHQEQKEKSWFITKDDDVMIGQQIQPIEKVGIYIPGGKAAYPSTVIMNAVPAKIAGVKNISLITPPQKDGSINPYVLVAAQLTGVDRIYKVGGAQAIAALAYGTETIEPVDKIVGPGNDYVARAKKFVYGDVAIDMIAGPSEICIIADESAPVDYVAADLLSQAEHDEAAEALCITMDETLAKNIQTEVNRQKETLERRAIIDRSLKQNGQIVITKDLNEAFILANEIAPEHLQLMIKDAALYINRIKHAGAIFIGNYSPEPLGDYLAGPNHTLPTNSTARFASPLGVYDFIKRSSIIHYSKQALMKEADHIMMLAEKEQLTAHKASIAKRKEDH